MPNQIDTNKIVIGKYATYFDTGVWDITEEGIIAPEDLTMRQLKDHLLASGGYVYLREDGRLGWIK